MTLLAACVYILSAVCLGSVLRGIIYRETEKNGVTLIADGLVGSILYSVIMGVLFHFTTNPELFQIVWGLFFAISIGLAIARKTYSRAELGGVIKNSNTVSSVVHSAAALLLAALTTYGFVGDSNEQEPPVTPEWGHHLDRVVHLNRVPESMAEDGLPGEVLGHRGVQLTFFPATYLVSPFNAETYVGVYKVIVFYAWFVLMALLFVIGKEIFGLRSPYSYVLSVGTMFFGAVHYPIFSLQQSTYAGFLKPALGAYHNTTILGSFVVGMAGIYYFYSGIKNRERSLILGVFLVAASFFYKPSFFTMLAPPMVIFLFYKYYKNRSRNYLVSVAILFSVPLAWNLYSSLFDLIEVPLNPAIRPFYLFFRWAEWRFPDFVTNSPVLFGVIVLFCSYLLLIMVSGSVFLKTRASEIRELIWFIGATFLMGSVSALVLVEDNSRLYHGNFAWGGHCVYLLMMPLLVFGFQNVKNAIYRSACWMVLCLHLYGGVVHLFLVVTEGRIV
ncbi:MAG: hypothetical protein GKR90_20650 [Pseudomonadales bacterium]|nr:hypothetical protein [Pseudomonadales bacterium]